MNVFWGLLCPSFFLFSVVFFCSLSFLPLSSLCSPPCVLPLLLSLSPFFNPSFFPGFLSPSPPHFFFSSFSLSLSPASAFVLFNLLICANKLSEARNSE